MINLAHCIPPSRPSSQRNQLPPVTIAHVRQSLEGKPWYTQSKFEIKLISLSVLTFHLICRFAGDINRKHAENVLRGAPSGTYLLRYNANDKMFALSLK